jgi:hypothetical protein
MSKGNSYEATGGDKITQNELECALNSLKKVTGIDNINMELLKNGGLSLMI